MMSWVRSMAQLCSAQPRFLKSRRYRPTVINGDCIAADKRHGDRGALARSQTRAQPEAEEECNLLWFSDRADVEQIGRDRGLVSCSLFRVVLGSLST